MSADAWRRAAADPAVDAALRTLYAELEAEVARRRPICLASGHCCHFDAFDHRLFVTGLEAAWCLRELGRGVSPAEVDAAKVRGDCPFLVEGRLCGARAARPLGCRAFFCDRAAAEWTREAHERCLAQLRRIHEEHVIPYRYGEWREMLMLLAQ